MSAAGAVTDAPPAELLDDLGKQMELPCEAECHDPAVPTVAQWWSRVTHTGCATVTVVAECEPCRAWHERVISDAAREGSRCHCVCGRSFPAADLEVSFTPIRGGS